MVGTLSADAGISKDLAQRDLIVIGLACACVMVGGLSQLLFGLLKMGSVVKYIPHPVVAGFMNGIALLLIYQQLHPFLGLERGDDLAVVFARFTPANGFSLLIGLSTLVAVFMSRKYLKRLPSLLSGLLVGSSVYALLIQFPEFATQYALAAVGELRATIPLPKAYLPLFFFNLSAIPLSLYSKLVVYGVVLGVVGSMESLMSSVAIDNLSGKRHDSNRELMGQGVGNMAASFFGALFCAGSIPRSSANYLAGSRSKLSGALCSLLILVIYLTMAPLIGRIPLAVFAGIIIAVGIDLFDRTTFRFAKAFLRTTTARKEVGVSFLINLSVAVITISVNLVTAVLIGVAISTIYSVAKMSTAVLRREFSGSRLTSKKVRQARAAEYLREHGERIRILELQKTIFFGSGLFTFGAGAVFGEMALLDGNPRSAQVLAEKNSEVYRLTQQNFGKLYRETPGIAVKLLQNIGVVLSHRLRVRSEEVRMLEDG